MSDENSGSSQPAQEKMPLRFSRLSGLVPARSVPCLRSTSYWYAVRRLRHSASDRLRKSIVSVVAIGTASPSLAAAMIAASATPVVKRARRLITRPLLCANPKPSMVIQFHRTSVCIWHARPERTNQLALPRPSRSR